MDPLASKKRPGGDIESPFASLRKAPKSAAPAANPYQTQPAPVSEPEITAEELALIEKNRLDAMAKRAAYEAQQAQKVTSTAMAVDAPPSPASPKKEQLLLQEFWCEHSYQRNSIWKDHIILPKSSPKLNPCLSTGACRHCPYSCPQTIYIGPSSQTSASSAGDAHKELRFAATLVAFENVLI